MKTKHLLLWMGALVFVGGVWFGRDAWRAHHKLVTLNVRNIPLAEVLRKIERQTWEKLRAEKGLDARITLHVKDKPLSYVLDWLAEQAGARWSTLYAIYGSSSGLSSLDSVLQGDGKLEPAGWTKIAPGSEAMEQPEPGDGGPVFRSGPPPDGPLPDLGLPPRPHGRMMFRRGPNGDVMMGQAANGEVQVWSPEELVLESNLKPRLDSTDDTPPTAEAAKEIAQKVNGKWTTYLALRKSIMGIGFSGPSIGLSGPSHDRPGLAPLKHGPNDRFARLTPEQRVLQARQRLQFTDEIRK